MVPAAIGALVNVSVVVLVCGRTHFLPLALAQIAAQEHVQPETVIVDDGPRSAAAMVSRLQKLFTMPIRYIRLQRRTSIGEKRLIGGTAAAGPIIAHWDDDDLYGSQRLLRQALPIANGSYTMSILGHQLIVEVSAVSRQVRWYWFANDPTFAPFFGSLVYHKSLLRVGFSNNSLGEDLDFFFKALEECESWLLVDGVPNAYVRHVDANARSSNTWDWQITREKCGHHLPHRHRQDKRLAYVRTPPFPELRHMCDLEFPCGGFLFRNRRGEYALQGEPQTASNGSRRWIAHCGSLPELRFWFLFRVSYSRFAKLFAPSAARVEEAMLSGGVDSLSCSAPRRVRPGFIDTFMHHRLARGQSWPPPPVLPHCGNVTRENNPIHSYHRGQHVEPQWPLSRPWNHTGGVHNLVRNLNFQGADVGTVRAAHSPRACYEACTKNLRCLGITFITTLSSKTTTKCWLKGLGFARGARYSDGTVSGVVRGWAERLQTIKKSIPMRRRKAKAGRNVRPPRAL